MAKAKLAIVLYPPVYYDLESNIEDTITTSKPLTVQLISMNISSLCSLSERTVGKYVFRINKNFWFGV